MDSYKSGNSYNHPSVKLKLQRNCIMNEAITQEEFEKKVYELTEKLNSSFYYDKEAVIDLWEEIEEYADIYHPNDYDAYYTEVWFTPNEGTNLKPIITHIMTSKYLYLYHHIREWLLDEEFEYTCGEKFAWMKKAEFATSNLEGIKALFCGKDIKKTVENSWDGEGSWIYAYLLMNPRREVVEWTLEHKDIFEFGEWDIKLALDHQVIPELRTLIENELKH